MGKPPLPKWANHGAFKVPPLVQLPIYVGPEDRANIRKMVLQSGVMHGVTPREDHVERALIPASRDEPSSQAVEAAGQQAAPRKGDRHKLGQAAYMREYRKRRAAK